MTAHLLFKINGGECTEPWHARLTSHPSKFAEIYVEIGVDCVACTELCCVVLGRVKQCTPFQKNEVFIGVKEGHLVVTVLELRKAPVEGFKLCWRVAAPCL